MTTENSNKISPEGQALHLIETNRVVETISLPQPSPQEDEWRSVSSSRRLQEGNRRGRSNDAGSLSNVTYSFVAPCSSARTVQESTSSLLAARAHAKAGRSDYAWEALDSLFAVQASNGFLPKYRYSPSIDSTEYYVNDTTIPNWPLFGTHLSGTNYIHPNNGLASKLGLHGSGRVSAMPLHATAVLEIFMESNHTHQDLAKLKQNFDRIYRYHMFLHEIVMRGCTSSSGRTALGVVRDTNRTQIPCYNVIHPWESLVDPASPLWKIVMHTVETQMRRQGWTIGFDVPTQVRDAFDHPTEQVYNAVIYLLECIANVTATCQQRNQNASIANQKESDVDCEDEIISKCPFAMLDAGYAAALSKSDEDMLKIAEVLCQHNDKHIHGVSRMQLSQLASWEEQSANLLANHLWSVHHQTFLSRSVIFDADGVNQSFVPKNETEPLVVPTGSNFMACWDTIEDTSMVNAMAFHLFQREGEFSFNCGRFPLWSTGGCDDDSIAAAVDGGNKTTHDASIYPALNYFVATGMSRNGAVGVGHYLANSTLNLVCGLPNTPSPGPMDGCSADILFHRAYNGMSNLPFVMDECGRTSTEAAAVVYNLMVPDKPFHYIPAPPIRSSWVIVLITAELVMAFTIGVSCLVLSLNLLRRLKADDGDDGAFVQRLNSAADSDLFGDEPYLSAAESFASEGASPAGDSTEERKNSSNLWSGPSPFRSMFGV